MSKGRGRGWHRESARHSQAARGIPTVKLVPIDPKLDFTEALRSLAPDAEPIKTTRSVRTRLPPSEEEVQERMGELIGNVFAERARLFDVAIDTMNEVGLPEIAHDLDTGMIAHAWDEVSRLLADAERHGSQADINRMRRAMRQMEILMPDWTD